MKTIDELADTKPNPEVDDFRAALHMVSEQACTTLVETRLWYLAIWVARLREHYVEVGRALQDQAQIDDRKLD